MIHITNKYQETLPNVRLIGQRYSNADRDNNGSFGAHWATWFAAHRFAALEPLAADIPDGNAYLGCMRSINGEFEYWIGMFCKPDSIVPSGYEFIDIPASTIGTCWLQGKEETGELYGMEAYEAVMASIQEMGWNYDESKWMLERYQCPRFTSKDAEGYVVLDYCAFLAD